MPNYKIADVIFSYTPKHEYTKNLCKKYVVENGVAEVSLTVSANDIEVERKKALPQEFPDYYLESLALYRKFLEYAFNHDTIILHSSALAVDGEGYLFTAPSGTGKSTHARLWREAFGEKVIMINDDKPVVRKIGDEFFVYGTPWNGKHRLDSNTKVRIKAICNLKRGEENSVKEISPKDMLFVLLNQTLRPTTTLQAQKMLEFLDKLLISVSLYEMKCNISVDAAKLAYEIMSGKKDDEN